MKLFVSSVDRVRVSSPTAEAVLALAELRAGHGATANPDGDGRWEVTVPLMGSGRGTVPEALAVTREWLDLYGLRSTSVTLDGHTHLLHGSLAGAPAMH